MGCIGDDGRDIMIYLLMLIPLEIIMTSTRVVKDGNRRKAVAIAGTLLALMSAVKVGWEVTNKAPSYFDMMEVLPTASTKEINKGYKAAAVRLHPDKRQSTGDDEDGDEAFVALKAAYDVLMDTNLRDVYSKFGLPGIEHKNDTTELMGTLGFFYVVWLAVAYLLTRRKAVAASQTWTFTGLLALGIFEYQVALAPEPCCLACQSTATPALPPLLLAHQKPACDPPRRASWLKTFCKTCCPNWRCSRRSTCCIGSTRPTCSAHGWSRG